MLRNRTAAELRPRLRVFASRHSFRTLLALQRSPQRDKIPPRRRRVRLGRARLRRHHADPQSAHSRTTTNTPFESAHVFPAFPAASPSSSLRSDRTHAERPSPHLFQVRSPNLRLHL